LRFSDANDLDQAIAIAFADTRILKLYLFSMTAWIIDPPVKRAGHFGLPTFEKGNSMLNLIYHLVLAYHSLGYGYPRELISRTTNKIVGATLLAFTLGGGTAVAQSTMAQRDACRPDVFRLCSRYIPAVGQIVTCLRGNEARLSEACHQVIFAEPTVSEGYAARSRGRPNIE
jgi:hypothetical protein